MNTVTPVDLELQVRKVDFKFSDEIPYYWFDNDPIKTHILNAQSIMFPEGERFFIQSVRNYQDQITDPVLKDQIKKFIGQEGAHGREHTKYNQWLTKKGLLHIPDIEKQVKKIITKRYTAWPKDYQLARTVAAEHLTHCFAQRFLANTDNLINKIHPAIRPLWLYHSLEELEHKAVAYDVYQQVSGRYWLRVRALLQVTWEFSFVNYLIMRSFMQKDSKWQGLKTLRQYLTELFGKKGSYRQVFWDWLAFFQPRFHPWKKDNRYLLKAKYETTQCALDTLQEA